MKKNKIIIDGNNTLYRGYYVFQDFITSTGKKSGPMYNFIQTIINLSKRLNTSDITIVWDFKGSKKRKERYAKIDLKSMSIINESDKVTFYKEGRNEDKEKLKEIISFIHEIQEDIKCFGIKQYQIEGYEADDLAASLVKKYKDTHKIYLYSTDNDWKSLIEPNVFLCSSSKKDIEIINRDMFIEKFQMPPEKYWIYKCFIGDKSDRIPGIKRVRKKEIIAFTNKCKNFSKMLETKKTSSEYVKKLFLNEEVIQLLKFNKDIIEFDYIDSEKLIPFSTEEKNEQKLNEIKEKYELETLMANSTIKNFLAIKH